MFFFNRCPSVERLERHAMSTVENDRISKHVAGCERCRKVVEDLRGDARLLEELRIAEESTVTGRVRDQLLKICRKAIRDDEAQRKDQG
jgi:hypothetical protein